MGQPAIIIVGVFGPPTSKFVFTRLARIVCSEDTRVYIGSGTSTTHHQGRVVVSSSSDNDDDDDDGGEEDVAGASGAAGGDDVDWDTIQEDEE